MVYDGDSVLEAKRQFRQFIVQSKTANSKPAGEPVTLFKNYQIIKEYQPHALRFRRKLPTARSKTPKLWVWTRGPIVATDWKSTEFFFTTPDRLSKLHRESRRSSLLNQQIGSGLRF